jgi:hypothetical protein
VGSSPTGAVMKIIPYSEKVVHEEIVEGYRLVWKKVTGQSLLFGTPFHDKNIIDLYRNGTLVEFWGGMGDRGAKKRFRKAAKEYLRLSDVNFDDC